MSIKKRLLSLSLAALLCIPAFAGCFTAKAAAADTGVTINVYNWGQYISDGTDGYLDVNAAFTEATGIEVNYMTFDTNESLYTKLKTGGSSYDIIVPSDYMAGRLIDEGLVQPLDFSNIPNYQYINEAYKNTAYDPGNEYSVPYTWGTVGVIYNKKYVDEADIGSWDLLWNEKYAGKILMFDNNRDAFAIAESRLGYSLNTTDSVALTACAELLKQQKPVVQQYVMDQIFDKMTREEAWIAPYYAGDYLTMLEDNPDLGFYFPQEGFNLFIDCLMIPSSAEHKAEAEAYINFLLSPEVCGENLDYLGYSAPEDAAKEYMDPEVSSSEIAYPSAETLARSEAFLYLPTESNQLMDSLWLDVKTGDSEDTTVMMAVTIGVIVLALAILLIHSLRKKRRRARRCRYYSK
ncbi:MAG: spermidine/putrescine ABC transporter substrate-binding protein [Oscillospiraceae bacterium]|nr:spermidine/putrescine ABC transporter substrate-binding protein [Oscillospiraceae bacterium]